MSRPANRWGCRPSEDVCLQHSMPLLCRHGCESCRDHRCQERERQAFERVAPTEKNFSSRAVDDPAVKP